MRISALPAAYRSAVTAQSPITLGHLWDSFLLIAATPIEAPSGNPVDDYVEFLATNSKPKWPGDEEPEPTITVYLGRAMAFPDRDDDRTFQVGASFPGRLLEEEGHTGEVPSSKPSASQLSSMALPFDAFEAAVADGRTFEALTRDAEPTEWTVELSED